jgi:hypothetical protein
MEKRGQVTIFIILGIVIVVAGVLVYMFYPQIKASFGFQIENPNAFLQSCLEEDIVNTINILAPQGGSIDPEFYYTYKNEKLEYLCYTNEDYLTCTMQQPFLKEHIEAEIEEEIKEEVNACLDDLERSFRGQGYEVILRKGDFSVELLPKRVSLVSQSSMSLKKEDTITYDSLSISVNNNLYELVAIVLSILNWEAHFGDAETTFYMDYYRDLKVEKLKQSDGTKIYILNDLNTGNKFQFATRSLAWPAGYSTT